MQQQITDLSARRDGLAEEVDGYLAQRDQLQPQVEQLAANITERGEELSSLEARIGDITGAGNTAPFSGRFVVEEGDTAVGMTLTLNEDDGFALESARGHMVEGTYSRTETDLVLSEATGSVGSARFPMSCPITWDDSGFRVGEAEGCLLDGLRFEKAL